VLQYLYSKCIVQCVPPRSSSEAVPAGLLWMGMVYSSLGLQGSPQHKITVHVQAMQHTRSPWLSVRLLCLSPDEPLRAKHLLQCCTQYPGLKPEVCAPRGTWHATA
jgi:hypothetical protein